MAVQQSKVSKSIVRKRHAANRYKGVQVTVCPSCGAKMVKNHSSIKKEIEVDECYTCGGKFLDNKELVKIRNEYENNEERDEDILRYVYQKVGGELAEQERKYAEIGTGRKTFVRKLFNKLTGYDV